MILFRNACRFLTRHTDNKQNNKNGEKDGTQCGHKRIVHHKQVRIARAMMKPLTFQGWRCKLSDKITNFPSPPTY